MALSGDFNEGLRWGADLEITGWHGIAKELRGYNRSIASGLHERVWIIFARFEVGHDHRGMVSGGAW